jgi:L-lactate dehydrogenase complex protein LldG
MAQNEARDAILARIRSCIKQSRIGFDPPSAPMERNYQRLGSRDSKERVELFAERLREYDARVTFTTPPGLCDSIGQVMGKVQSHTQAPRAPFWIVADGFPAGWLPSQQSIRWESSAPVDDLNRCAGVLTICSVGIAITGTIVLQHGQGEGKRQTTLIPDRHLCVIRTAQIVETVPEAFDRLATAATHPLTFISGPSATADIEMTRIRGVHGPRQLDVFLLGE